MANNATFDKFTNLLNSLGKSTVHSIYPDDFEYYAFAIELVDSADRLVDYILFPVNPKSIQIGATPVLSVRKTAGGIVSMGNTTNSPKQVTMSGTFGRKFRFLAGQDLIDGTAFEFSQLAFKETQQFSRKVKTGYGVCKVLERIYEKSRLLDEYNSPYKVYLYNLALNSHHLVEFSGLTFSQNQEENMLWNYQVMFKTLVPLYQIQDKLDNTIQQTLRMQGLSKSINTSAEEAMRGITLSGNQLLNVMDVNTNFAADNKINQFNQASKFLSR